MYDNISADFINFDCSMINEQFFKLDFGECRNKGTQEKKNIICNRSGIRFL